MKARPILFSGPMVRALLAGTKTQTRRIVKPQPEHGLQICHYSRTGWAANRDADGNACTCNQAPAPYGVPGDLLWARETCAAIELDSGPDEGLDGVRYVADGKFQAIENTVLAAQRWLALHTYNGHSGARVGPQVPSIHMPRWASRLTLEITDVRVERLQGIAEDDALAEGVRWSGRENGQDFWSASWPAPGVRSHQFRPSGAKSPQAAYLWLWDLINGPGAAEVNPWVWAVSFKLHQQNVDAFLLDREAA